jgi:ABC-type transporter Mla subunit MlaD
MPTRVNSVDIALIVAFSILGAALLAAVVWFIVKFSYTTRASPPPPALKYSSYDADEGEA